MNPLRSPCRSVKHGKIPGIAVGETLQFFESLIGSLQLPTEDIRDLEPKAHLA